MQIEYTSNWQTVDDTDTICFKKEFYNPIDKHFWHVFCEYRYPNWNFHIENIDGMNIHIGIKYLGLLSETEFPLYKRICTRYLRKYIEGCLDAVK